MIITGAFALDADAMRRVPHEWVENLHQPIIPLHVRELMRKDEPAALFGPFSSRGRQQNRVTQNAPRHGGNVLVAEQQTNRSSYAERKGQLLHKLAPTVSAIRSRSFSHPPYVDCSDYKSH